MKSPSVTVICPTFNRQDALRCALRGVLQQSFADFEVWVVGDGCTDDSEAVVRGFNDPRLNWLNLPSNTGSQTEPNNEGLRRARGEFIAFIGHDDLWFPWHLECLVGSIRSSGADLVHDLCAAIGPGGPEHPHGAPHPDLGYSRVYIPTSSWLHRAELTREIGFWRKPEHLAWAIDFDFTRRAALAGKKFEFVDRLGVLKFHSAVWQLYSRSGPAPAQSYLEEMARSAEASERRVLSELAARYSWHCQAQDKVRFSMALREARRAGARVIKAAFREFLYSLGPERWPVKSLLTYQARRARARFRTVRGLPAYRFQPPMASGHFPSQNSIPN